MDSTKQQYYIKLLLLIIGFCYFSYVIITYPFVGVLTTQNDKNECEITVVAEFGWANYNGLQLGDKLQCDGSISNVKHERESTLTVISEHTIDTVNVDYSTLPTGAILYQILPIIYFVIIFFISYSLHKRSKYSLFSHHITIIVLLIAGAYLSSWVAAREDVIGGILCTFFILLVPVKIIVYLETIKGTKKNILKWTKLILNTVVIIFSCLDYILYEEGIVTASFFISIFSLLVVYLLIYIYQHYNEFMQLIRSVRIKFLLRIICLIYVPVLLLYAIPLIVFDYSLISEEIIVLFPLLISFVILYISFAKVFYDLDHFIKLIAKYFVFSIIISALLVFIFEESTHNVVSLVIFTTIILMMSLFAQNYLLPLSRNKKLELLNNSLHTLTLQAREAKTIDEVLQYLKFELKKALQINRISILTYSKKNGLDCREDFIETSEADEIVQLLESTRVQVGDLYDLTKGYLLVINHGIELTLIKLSYKNNIIKMSDEEEKWLSTLAIHLNLTMESFHKVNELYSQLQEKANLMNSLTGSRLLAIIGERERVKLAEHIHDSILQELIALKKLIELYQLSGDADKLISLNEQINRQINLIRDICFDLNPPFFNNQGLIESLQHLVQKYEKMCSITFYFDYNKDIANSQISKDIMLHFYRIFNELLLNAKKHSYAKVVYISIKKQQSKLVLLYEDDGIGMNLDEIQKNNFGLYNIKERVRSLNGELNWSSNPNGGMTIKVIIDSMEIEKGLLNG